MTEQPNKLKQALTAEEWAAVRAGNEITTEHVFHQGDDDFESWRHGATLQIHAPYTTGGPDDVAAGLPMVVSVPRTLVVDDTRDLGGPCSGPMLPAIMALCNHALPDDDPGKITRADIEAIGAGLLGIECIASERCCSQAESDVTDAERVALTALRAKLNALLPPE